MRGSVYKPLLPNNTGFQRASLPFGRGRRRSLRSTPLQITLHSLISFLHSSLLFAPRIARHYEHTAVAKENGFLKGRFALWQRPVAEPSEYYFCITLHSLLSLFHCSVLFAPRIARHYEHTAVAKENGFPKGRFALWQRPKAEPSEYYFCITLHSLLSLFHSSILFAPRIARHYEHTPVAKQYGFSKGQVCPLAEAGGGAFGVPELSPHAFASVLCASFSISGMSIPWGQCSTQIPHSTHSATLWPRWAISL